MKCRTLKDIKQHIICDASRHYPPLKNAAGTERRTKSHDFSNSRGIECTLAYNRFMGQPTCSSFSLVEEEIDRECRARGLYMRASHSIHVETLEEKKCRDIRQRSYVIPYRTELKSLGKLRNRLFKGKYQ